MPRSCRDCLPMMPTELSAVLPARHIQEECGVFGVYAPETTDVAPLAYYALYALQHRGQESAGIAVNDDGVFTAYRDVGLVNEVFPAERLRSLGTGTIAVGHVRYGTTGSDNKRNVQPILVNHYKGRMALAHNGNLTNSHALRQELESQGSIFQTTTDSEVIAYIIVQERLRAPSIEKAVSAAMDRIEGAYSLVISSPTKLIAVRDPHGFRPLCMGRLRDGGVVFASESCALDAIGARFERDILPGEIVVADKSGVKSDTRHCGKVGSACSSSSTSPGRTPSSTGPASTWHGSGPGPSWPWSTRSRRTSSSVCRTPAWTPPWATPGRAVSPTAWGSSRTSTSAAPSSPPLRPCGKTRSISS